MELAAKNGGIKNKNGGMDYRMSKRSPDSQYPRPSGRRGGGGGGVGEGRRARLESEVRREQVCACVCVCACACVRVCVASTMYDDVTLCMMM